VYNAGFIRAVLEGRPLKECLIAGNAVSGYTVTKKGARTAPDTEQLQKFLEEHQAE
ncbi:PfkB family carbohydrate kinase, partial [Anaerostipes caccae]